MAKEGRQFLDLTNEEVKEIVSDIFKPKKITCIKRDRDFDEISCKIYTEWEPEKPGQKPITIVDELFLKNPFIYGHKAISVDMSVINEDYKKLKQYCFAHGVTDGLDDYLRDNPYLKKEDEKCASEPVRMPIYRIMLQENSGAEMKNGWPDTGCQADMGFYYRKEDAIAAMHENTCDIRECVYDYGYVIEQMPGLYTCPGPDSRIYFAWDDQRGGFFEAEEPKEMRHLSF